MRDVKVDLTAGTAVIAAGALVGEVIAEAHKNKAHVGRLFRVIFPPRLLIGT